MWSFFPSEHAALRPHCCLCCLCYPHRQHLFCDVGCVDECSIFGFHLPVTYHGNMFPFAYYLSDYSVLGRYLCRFLAHILAVFAVYLPLSFMRSLCVLDTSPVSDMRFANIFSYSVIYSFVILALFLYIYKFWPKGSCNNVFLHISHLWYHMRKVVTAAKVN